MTMFRRRNEGAYRWDILANYNAERARGIVHTAEWRARMAREQDKFNVEHGYPPRAAHDDGLGEDSP